MNNKANEKSDVEKYAMKNNIILIITYLILFFFMILLHIIKMEKYQLKDWSYVIFLIFFVIVLIIMKIQNNHKWLRLVGEAGLKAGSLVVASSKTISGEEKEKDKYDKFSSKNEAVSILLVYMPLLTIKFLLFGFFFNHVQEMKNLGGDDKGLIQWIFWFALLIGVFVVLLVAEKVNNNDTWLDFLRKAEGKILE